MNSVSIVIPVYNEIRTLAEMLDHVRIAPTAGLKKEVIVVDDGSTDGSTEYLQQLDENGVSLIFHKSNQGKGCALQTPFSRATREVLLLHGADLAYHPEANPELLRP